MRNESGADSELEICSRLLRSLSHRVRGDLSVIANDLVYLSTIVGPDEIMRSRERCDRIAATLSAIGDLENHRQKVSVPLLEVLQIFGLKGLSPEMDELRVNVASGLLKRCAALLVVLVGNFCQINLAAASNQIVLLTLVYDTNFNTQTKMIFNSVSSFAAAQLGERFVVEAALIDLILRDHRWITSVECEALSVVLKLRIQAAQVV